MTHQEKRWLVFGIVAGMLIAGIALGVFLRFQSSETTEIATPQAPILDEPALAAGMTPAASQLTVQLSPDEQRKIGLQTTEVQRELAVDEILTIGRVEEPETSLATVSTRFGGRIEHLFVNFTGQPVQKGDPVATIAITGQPAGKDDPVASIYSRELITAAEEYKFALDNKQRAQSMARPDAIAQADALVEASRIRLERFGLTSEQIGRVLATPEQPILITVIATASGILQSRKVAEGQFVNAGDALIDLTDLKTVWVKADVFDSDLARIRPGLSAAITSEAVPGLKLIGVVGLIESRSNPQTRTTPVRIQVNNPGARLKPGMVVQATFRMTQGAVLTVPRDAVIDTGTEKVVYVARDNGVFQQQPIEVGPALKDHYRVTAGLAPGDKVVTNGVFLVDSQTRLTGALTGMFGGSKSYTETEAPATPSRSSFNISFRIDPDPPSGGKDSNLHVTLTDPAGKPVRDAQVRLTFVMPAMPAMNMPEMRNSAELKWTGAEYVGPIQIMTAGGWNVAIEARRGGELLATTQTRVNAR